MSTSPRQAAAEAAPQSREPHDDMERARESERILRRIHEETAPQIGAGRMVTHARDHFSARDADPSDPIEVLGTRLGRALALVVFVALAVSLVLQFAGG